MTKRTKSAKRVYPARPTLPMTSAQAHEDALIQNALYFTTFRFHGRGQRDRREFETLEAAARDAAGDPRCQIYAVYSRAIDIPVPMDQIDHYLHLRKEV